MNVSVLPTPGVYVPAATQSSEPEVAWARPVWRDGYAFAQVVPSPPAAAFSFTNPTETMVSVAASEVALPAEFVAVHLKRALAFCAGVKV